MTWTIEFRPELPPGERFEVMEETAHRGTFNTDEEALAFAREYVEDADIKFANWPDDREPVEREPHSLDPLTSMDARAVTAENMLNQYCMLRVNLKTRESIHRLLWNRNAGGERTQAAYQQVVQAQAELDQCKYEILELMGVDA